MLHARPDYNRIQDPALNDPSLLSPGSTPIAAEEPVFLLRAQDVTAAAVLRFWAYLNKDGDSNACAIALAQADKMDAWPTKKTADVPK
jgi:hypothetical protein